MKKLGFVAVALCGIALSGSALALECKAPTEPYTPKWSVGDRWEYEGDETFRGEVMEVIKGGYVLESYNKSGKFKSWTTSVLNSIRGEQNNRRWSWDPYSPTLPNAPMAVGVQERGTVFFRSDGNLRWTRSFVTKVTGFEQVESPAGKFCAFRIETTLEGGPRSQLKTIWFSQEFGYTVKLVIEEGGEVTFQQVLKSFRRGK